MLPLPKSCRRWILKRLIPLSKRAVAAESDFRPLNLTSQLTAVQTTGFLLPSGLLKCFFLF